jgi:AcrR family transcriptional regulator
MEDVKGAASARARRRDSAKATQSRIVKAAYELFRDQGYAATTMAQVAQRAGVAVQTVYFGFHTKPALLSRAFDFAVLGEEEPQPPQSQAWYRAMEAEPELAGALRHLVAGIGSVEDRVVPIAVAARIASDADPETRRVMDMHEQWRVDGFRGMLEVLRAKAPLRPGVSPAQATDALLFFLGNDAYRFMVQERGWTFDAWVDWTTEVLAEQLFAAAASSSSGSAGKRLDLLHPAREVGDGALADADDAAAPEHG